MTTTVYLRGVSHRILARVSPFTESWTRVCPFTESWTRVSFPYSLGSLMVQVLLPSPTNVWLLGHVPCDLIRYGPVPVDHPVLLLTNNHPRSFEVRISRKSTHCSHSPFP